MSEDELIKCVQKISMLNLTEQSPKDKIYIEYLNYIFTRGFTKKSLVLPVKKRDKIAFQYLVNFVKILSILFGLKKNERNNLYQTKRSDLSQELKTYFSNLYTSIKKSDITFNKNKLYDKILFIMYNYYNELNKTLSDSLTYYAYCFGFIFPEANMFKFVLYNFLKTKFLKLFEKYDFNGFCPNLQSNNCLNLLLLFFKNTANNKLEILAIYGLLIFKYEYIFREYEKDISIEILEASAIKTYDIVKEKTLDNCIILEYIFAYYIRNLENIIKNYKENEINSIINNISEQNYEKREKIDENKNKKNNEISNNDKKLNLNIDQSENNFLNKNTNDVQRKNIKETPKNEKSMKRNPNNPISLKSENITEDKENIDEKGLQKEQTSNDYKEIQFQQNMQTSNEEKEMPIDKNNTIESPKKEEDLITKIDSVDKINGNDKKDHAIISVPPKIDSNQSTEIQIKDLQSELKQLKNLIDTLKKDNNEMKNSINALEKNKEENQQNYNALKNDVNALEKDKEENQQNYNELKNDVNQLKIDIKNLKLMVGKVQIRDMAKNFLNNFQTYLTKKDWDIIKMDKRKKWDLIVQRVEDTYLEYKINPKFPAFIEVFKKSKKVIENENNIALNLNIDLFEKEILEISKECNK